jgi:hypothetical protein
VQILQPGALPGKLLCVERLANGSQQLVQEVLLLVVNSSDALVKSSYTKYVHVTSVMLTC